MMTVRNNGGPLIVTISILAMMILAACGKSPAKEVARVQSPDVLVDAVLAERDVGATAPVSSEIYIVPHGDKIRGEPVLRADKMQGLRITWKQPKFVEVRYLKGRIFSFTNFWESPEVDNFRYVVELRLEPASEGNSLN